MSETGITGAAAIALALAAPFAVLVVGGFNVGMQRRALRHDRQMRELEDLRALLDEASVALFHAAHVSVHASFEAYAQPFPIELLGRLLAADERLRPFGTRLLVRLSQDDNVVSSFHDAEGAMQDYVAQFSSIERLPPEERFAFADAQLPSCSERLTNAIADFVAAGRAKVNLQATPARTPLFQLSDE